MSSQLETSLPLSPREHFEICFFRSKTFSADLPHSFQLILVCQEKLFLHEFLHFHVACIKPSHSQAKHPVLTHLLLGFPHPFWPAAAVNTSVASFHCHPPDLSRPSLLPIKLPFSICSSFETRVYTPPDIQVLI